MTGSTKGDQTVSGWAHVGRGVLVALAWYATMLASDFFGWFDRDQGIQNLTRWTLGAVGVAVVYLVLTLLWQLISDMRGRKRQR